MVSTGLRTQAPLPPSAPSSSPSERGVVTRPASLLHDTRGAQARSSAIDPRTWRVPPPASCICPEAPPMGLVTSPWTWTLDSGHMLVMRQGLEPSHTAAEWIVFPSAHSLSPSFLGTRKVSLIHRSRAPSQTKHCFPLRNSQVGLWDSGFSGRCRDHCVQGGPSKAGWVIDLCSH